ncbi:hypothetical protein DFH27DRAFT_613307 [Peziza echinospora]|nr:hypothetical protein DFH27DRAFT_613307 [Peziza echinospora]
MSASVSVRAAVRLSSATAVLHDASQGPDCYGLLRLRGVVEIVVEVEPLANDGYPDEYAEDDG